MKIKNKNLLTFTLLCSFVTLTLQGRPGPGSGDYPAEGTGFVKEGDDWDNDTTGITFLNKWRQQQQAKSMPAAKTITKKSKDISPAAQRKTLRKQLLADFDRLMNDLEADWNTSSPTPTSAYNTQALQAPQVLETSVEQKTKTIIESDTETGTQNVTNETEEIVRGIVDSAA